ncbi:MAG: hypothetical protein IIA91_05890 [Chloroflexi bacterium]|nr:hypothetical protein [Chloroflexota bacterium]
MEREELIEHARRILSSIGQESGAGAYAQVCELLRTYAGPKSSFLETLKTFERRSGTASVLAHHTAVVLQSFIDYLEAGLLEKVSPERQAQLDVVSDFLEQANALLESKEVHPAGAAVLIGATLEEFLRTWAEAAELPLGNRKPGLEAYTHLLRDADLITKQDAKDITSWGGIRNHAAHGEWEVVSDKNRIRLMLEGVNLFMRKYEQGQGQ